MEDYDFTVHKSVSGRHRLGMGECYAMRSVTL